MSRTIRLRRRREFLKSALAGALGAVAAPLAGAAAVETNPSAKPLPNRAAEKSAGASSGAIKVYMSAAVEDFVAPRSDDIVMEVARTLSRLGIRGNFHLTGDKIRTLAGRGRKDVIDALGKHVVGYHTNSHGMRPFLGGLLDDPDWDSSVRQVLAAEAPGARDVHNAFGRMPAYYVSEFDKGPQLIRAYQLMGIPAGLNVSSLSSLPGLAVWFCGSLLLNPQNLIALEHPPETPDRLNTIKRHIDERLQRARSSDGMAVAFLHPYKYASPSAKSWGAWNASYRGAASPEGPLEMPPMFSEKITADLLDQFGRLAAYIQAQEGVAFVDHLERALDLPQLGGIVGGPELHRGPGGAIAGAIQLSGPGRRVAFAGRGVRPLVRSLAHYKQTNVLPPQVMLRPLLGPVREPMQRTGVVTDGRAVLNACPKIDAWLDERGYVPASTPVLYISLGPGTLLRAMARVYLNLQMGNTPQETLDGLDGPELPEASNHEYFQEKTFTHGDLYPDGFTGEQVCRYSLWQSWSLKPAV